MHRKRVDPLIISFTLAGGLVIGLILLALFTLLATGLTDPESMAGVFTDTEALGSILLTFAAAGLTVLVLVLFGTPLAYLMARTTSRWTPLVEVLVDLPLVIPHTVAGIMVYLLFMRRGMIGTLFAPTGIIFEDALPGIIAAMCFVGAPYYINSAREGFQKVSPRLENVAMTLGATRAAAFRTVVLPLASRDLVAGMVLAWGRAVGEFAAVVMIAYYPQVIATLTYTRFTQYGLHASIGLACLLLLLCSGVFMIFRALTRRIGRYDDRP